MRCGAGAVLHVASRTLHVSCIVLLHVACCMLHVACCDRCATGVRQVCDRCAPGVHVPLFMKYPRLLRPHSVFTHPVSHVDIFPTLAAQAGSTSRLGAWAHPRQVTSAPGLGSPLRQPNPSGAALDGVDLIPLVLANASGTAPPPPPPHAALFWREGEYQAVLSEGWKLHLALQVSARSCASMERCNTPTNRCKYNRCATAGGARRAAAQSVALPRGGGSDREARRRGARGRAGADQCQRQCRASAVPCRTGAVPGEQVRRLQRLLDGFNLEQAEPMWPSVAAIPIALDHSVATPDKPDEDHVYWPN